ncbi:MAG: winged helix-turn-helix transcriptional regulator [Thermosipho sp. (in: Bacteria)]|nr:winged helix-turn-helix transcriptional regulator [Thermosipho sp. (in: thermotogales)]
MSDNFEEIANILKAMGHPTRLKILFFLAQKKHCVCELLSKLGINQPNLSQHLAILRNLGLIKDERNGNMVIYKLVNNRIVETVLKNLK